MKYGTVRKRAIFALLALLIGGRAWAVVDQADVNSTPPTETNPVADMSMTPWGGLRTQLNLLGADLGLGRSTMSGSLPVALASDQPAISVVSQDAAGTAFGTATATATGNFVVFTPAQTAGYARLTFNYTAASGGSIIEVDESWDNTTWIAIFCWTSNAQNSSFFNAFGGSNVISCPLRGPYIRIKANSVNSGTATVQYSLRSAPMAEVVTVFLSADGATVGTLGTPATTGGLTNARIESVASTNSTSVKASAAQFYAGHLGNNGAADAWLKLYNKASAPACGTDTPVVSIYIPKGAATPIGAADIGLGGFGSGLGYCITGGKSDSDTTAVAADQVTGFIGYK